MYWRNTEKHHQKNTTVNNHFQPIKMLFGLIVFSSVVISLICAFAFTSCILYIQDYLNKSNPTPDTDLIRCLRLAIMTITASSFHGVLFLGFWHIYTIIFGVNLILALIYGFPYHHNLCIYDEEVTQAEQGKEPTEIAKETPDSTNDTIEI